MTQTPAQAGRDMRIRVAYADPPDIGQARRHYSNEPTYAGEVDHAALIERLVRDYPDGWALSCSSPSLRQILPMCPPETRVAAWVKPVLFLGGRKRRNWRIDPTVRDHVSAPIEMRKGLAGAKPAPFCYWLFELLNLQRGDILDDLFPGSGAVSEAWMQYQNQLWSQVS
jgi:hypothetical protein